MTTYFILRPSYEVKHYKLGFYPYTYLTQMIYTTIGDRQLIYIYGKHEEESYPVTDFVVQHNFSGFDTYSMVNVVCDSNRNIVLCFEEGAFVTPTPSEKIKVRRVFIEELNYQPGMIIRAN